MEIGFCPKTSRDANGYNRYCRIKALPKVAGINPTPYSAEAKQVKCVFLVHICFYNAIGTPFIC